MIATSTAKVSGFIGKVRCSAATVDALLCLNWQKPNRQVLTAEPLTQSERAQLLDVVALTGELLRVGPVTGLERLHATAYVDWTRDTFFPGKAVIGAPNAVLFNTSAAARVVELKSISEAKEADCQVVLAANEALVFPINEVWFKTQGHCDFVILRGFFIGVHVDTLGAVDV